MNGVIYWRTVELATYPSQRVGLALGSGESVTLRRGSEAANWVSLVLR